eukprot:TRINITY_DN7374_c0_g1_i2.p2 TRINITY_DN7374_c0_g1~~TRINITY_DN7374_c0_g1_i2.p2  ORF type:complete len:100 (-),score=8.98 TRINITY_DN7374_c0_g1_i2:69-368(-)
MHALRGCPTCWIVVWLATSAVCFASASSCGLACWLASLTLSVPPTSFDVAGFNCTLQRFVCVGVELGASPLVCLRYVHKHTSVDVRARFCRLSLLCWCC